MQDTNRKSARLFSSARQLPVRSALKDICPTPVSLLFNFQSRTGWKQQTLFIIYETAAIVKLAKSQSFSKSKKNFLSIFYHSFSKGKQKHLSGSKNILQNIFTFLLRPLFLYVIIKYIHKDSGRNHGLFKPFFRVFLFCAVHGLAACGAHDQSAKHRFADLFAHLLRVGRTRAFVASPRHDAYLLSRCYPHRRT